MKIKIAISGVGNRTLPKDVKSPMWGWLEQVKCSEFFELVGVHDVAESALQRAVKRGYVAATQTFTDLDELYNQTQCQALIVANPVSSHAQSIQWALDRNIHLLVEKPFVHSALLGRDILANNQSQTVVNVVQNWRAKSAALAAKQFIASEKFGKAGQIFFQYIRNRENPKLPDYLFQEKSPLLYAVGIHHIDLFQYILQDTICSVQGSSFKPSWSRYQDDSGVNLTMTTERGCTIIYTGTFSSQNTILPNESWILEGEKGTLLSESRSCEPPLWFIDKDSQDKIDLTAEITERTEPEQFNLADQTILRNFYDTIAGNEDALCSVSDAVQTLGVLEAVVQACETGQKVLVEKIKSEIQFY